MKKISIYTLLVVAGIGCKKNWLDIKADKTLSIPATLKDFQAMMDDQSTMNYDGISLTEVASDDHFVIDDIFQSAENKPKNAYTWSYSTPYISLADWSITYNRVFTANVVLEGLQKLDKASINTDKYRNIRGQALYLRADAFFRAAQAWAPPYEKDLSKDKNGIPLRLEADITLPTTRSTLEDTYNQIISDLSEAFKLLPDSPAYRTRPSKQAVSALLARTFMSMRSYDMAQIWADSCLNSYNHLMDYNTVNDGSGFIGDFTSNPEVIFHIIMETGGNSDFLTWNCLIDSSLYKSYDANDLRKDLFFEVNTDGTIMYTGNYYSSNTELFTGTATDEMYLVRAECYARQGQVSKAMIDLNTLLEKRFKSGTFVPYTANSIGEALSKILIERRKELLLRGLRWIDLRRLNFENQYKTTLTRNINGKIFTIDPNSFKYTFPIPDDIIGISGINQNNGWQ